MCTCMDIVDDIWWIETPCVWSLSICKLILRTWLSFFLVYFFHGPSCVQPFFVCLDLHVSTFFSLIAHVSFVTKDGERKRDHNHIMWSFYFVGCKKWYNANFSWKHSKGVYGVHVNLDHESMKRILPRVTTI